MSEHSEFLAEAGTIQWEREVRGYNRQQVDEFVAWRAGQIRELENKLSQGLAEIERLRREVSDARDSAGRPAHEEISERVGKYLKLAAEEAMADRERGLAEIAQMREGAKQETDQLRADTKRETDQARAQSQDDVERMLTAAQEQSERTVAKAKAEADTLVSTTQAAAEQTIAEANKHAETTVAAADAKAKQQLDDATARATAIHDGAERRLNLLISRHTETVRRLTEIRDVVTSLVSGEAARGSLEDEVNRALGGQPANGATAVGSGASGDGDGRPASQNDPLQVGAHRAGQRLAGAAESRRGAALGGSLDPLSPDSPSPDSRSQGSRSPDSRSQGSRSPQPLPRRQPGSTVPSGAGASGLGARHRDNVDPLGTDHREDPRRREEPRKRDDLRLRDDAPLLGKDSGTASPSAAPDDGAVTGDESVDTVDNLEPAASPGSHGRQSDRGRASAHGADRVLDETAAAGRSADS